MNSSAQDSSTSLFGNDVIQMVLGRLRRDVVEVTVKTRKMPDSTGMNATKSSSRLTKTSNATNGVKNVEQ